MIWPGQGTEPDIFPLSPAPGIRACAHQEQETKMRMIFAAGLGLLALTLPALAGPRDDVLYGISRCGGIADDRTWLDCVYGAAQPMRAQLGLPPAPVSQQKLVPPAFPGTAAPAQSFGPQGA